jgi:two-component system, NarL family, response regulator LiaR
MVGRHVCAGGPIGAGAWVVPRYHPAKPVELDASLQRFGTETLDVAPQPLRVVVVSRHELTRAGFVSLLARHPERVFVCDVSSQGGHLATCDAVVYDLFDLAGTAGIEDLTHLLANGVPVVALDASSRPALGAVALAMGVAEVVPLDVTGDQLAAAVERAAAGTSSRRPGEGYDDAVHAALKEQFGLTERELDILALIGLGMPNQAIAGQLFLSSNSVKTYIRWAYKKIGAKSRSQAVLWATQNRLRPRHQGRTPENRSVL